MELQDKHWSELKKMMESAGQIYEGKAQAIAFLSAVHQENETPGPAANDHDDTPPVFIDNVPDVFDKNKQFGEIVGIMEEYPTARYAQNGKLYTSEGTLING